MFLMLDAIEVSAVAGLRFDALAGYVGGNWPDYSAMCSAYPALAAAGRICGYAVNAGEDAELLDCEVGDATVAQADPWVGRQLARGVWRPGVYANLSRWRDEGLWDALAHHGSSIRRIVADWTYQPGILQGFDAQQWTDRYLSRNVDGNSCQDSFFHTTAPPPVVNPQHYDWFPTGPFPSKRWGDLDERLIVEEYDGARQHPKQYATYLPKLQAVLQWLADRDRFVAMHLHPNPDGSPSWQDDHRGWRFQQLIHRAAGHRFV